MFSKKSLFVPTVLIFASFLGGRAANAQNPPCYTVASLQGTWAIIGNYGSNLAISLASESIDGNGNLTRTAVINEPATTGSTTGARTIVTSLNTGTYTVNCNGTGTITRITTTAANGTFTGMDDFVITGAILKPGNLFNPQGQFIATTIADAQQAPSTIVPGGIFLTRVHTRLPDPGPTK